MFNCFGPDPVCAVKMLVSRENGMAGVFQVDDQQLRSKFFKAIFESCTLVDVVILREKRKVKSFKAQNKFLRFQTGETNQS